MPNQYRIVEETPGKFSVQLKRVDGWANIMSSHSYASIRDAVSFIEHLKRMETWKPRYYDENGNLVATAVPTPDQPVEDA